MMPGIVPRSVAFVCLSYRDHFFFQLSSWQNQGVEEADLFAP